MKSRKEAEKLQAQALKQVERLQRKRETGVLFCLPSPVTSFVYPQLCVHCGYLGRIPRKEKNWKKSPGRSHK
jgi:hypothetical protein